MFSLPEPQVDDAKLYVEIAGAKKRKRRNILLNIRAVILDAYVEYIRRAPDVDRIPGLNLSAEERESLKHAFEVPTIPMNALRSQLTAIALAARCCYCGLSESSTLDHYLPKEHYPQFAIFSRNLSPTCATCNTRKSDKVVIEHTNVRSFLHPYYDEIPNNGFFRMSLVIGEKFIALQFEVHRPRGMNGSVFEQLRSHVESLGLKERYQKMALLNMSDERASYRRWFEIDGTGIRLSEALSEKSRDCAADYGDNYWLTVLYSALSQNREFCQGGFRTLG